MGKAYSDEQRTRVRALLEAGRDEETIEKETGVSDRTIRRWKLELERTGRIGKPPESRTGRNRVLSAEVETALYEYVKAHPTMSVDDILWWLYDTFKLVVGTRTVRRVFERKGDNVMTKRMRSSGSRSKARNGRRDSNGQQEDDAQQHMQSMNVEYSSPYQQSSPTNTNAEIENQLRMAMQQETPQQHPYPALAAPEAELPDDEELLQLELRRVALEKQEVELKLRIKRAQESKRTPAGRRALAAAADTEPSPLFNPAAALAHTPSIRDSRSKKKIAEAKQRTAERQERMLRELERRSRRRDHLTTEWVQSKDVWPMRAQARLADLMHQSGCYSYSHNNEATFEAIFHNLYQLVDHSSGDWEPEVHDDMLRDRTKRKMSQLRAKMQKTGEIVERTDGFPGFKRAEDYTGEAAGDSVGDESDMAQDPALQGTQTDEDDQQQQHRPPPPPDGLVQQHPDEAIQYDPVPPDQHQQMQQTSALSYPPPDMLHQSAAQYALMDQHHNMMPYGPMGSQQSLPHQDNIVM